MEREISGGAVELLVEWLQDIVHNANASSFSPGALVANHRSSASGANSSMNSADVSPRSLSSAGSSRGGTLAGSALAYARQQRVQSSSNGNSATTTPRSTGVGVGGGNTNTPGGGSYAVEHPNQSPSASPLDGASGANSSANSVVADSGSKPGSSSSSRAGGGAGSQKKKKEKKVGAAGGGDGQQANDDAGNDEEEEEEVPFSEEEMAERLAEARRNQAIREARMMNNNNNNDDDDDVGRGGAGLADENDVENDKNHKDYSPRERPRGRKERHRVRSMRGEAAPRTTAATANLNTANPNNANNANNAGRHNRPPDPFSLPFRLREARGGGVHMHIARSASWRPNHAPTK